MCFHILPTRSHRRIFLSSAVLHSPYSVSDLQRDAPLLCQVKVLSQLATRPSLILPLVIFLGHSSPILCASFSPTGNLLATGSGDTNARLWDLFTETPSHTLTGHRGWVLCVEWEALERKLATGGHDGHVSYVLPSQHTHERNSPSVRVGPDMGPQDWKTYW
jgi:WD40 repeat protein